MKKIIVGKRFWILFALIQLIFAAGTGLLFDEAYYWYFSLEPDWGYFDHPPLTAWLIWIGTHCMPIPHAEIAVRFVFVLLTILTFSYAEKKLISRDNIYNYRILILGFPAISAAGIFAAPDTPAMCLAVISTIMVSEGIKNIKNAILFGLMLALMALTKYTLVLLVPAWIIAKPSALLQPYLYLSASLAMILIIPHILWLDAHHWITFEYHLNERSSIDEWALNQTVDFVAGTVMLSGICIPFGLRVRTEPGQRIWLSIFATSFVICLLASFFGRVEANWMLATLPALLIIASQNTYRSKSFYILSGLLAALLLALKFSVVGISFVGYSPYPLYQLSGWKSWSKELETESQGYPVVFLNSYQRASVYMFYTGQSAYSLNTVNGRRNEFSLRKFEIPQDSVLFVQDWHEENFIQKQVGFDKLFFKRIYAVTPPFGALVIPDTKLIKVSPSESFTVSINCYSISNAKLSNTQLFYYWHGCEEMKNMYYPSKNNFQDSSGEITIQAPHTPGKYYLQFGIEDQNKWKHLASHRIYVVVNPL